MAVLFPKIYKVIRRNNGAYIDGVWTPGVESKPEDIYLNIQPASIQDYQRTQAIFAGRRVSAMYRAFADIDAGLTVAGEDGHPGDIVIYNNERHLVIGKAIWNTLNSPITSHVRYMLVMESEHEAGEVAA